MSDESDENQTTSKTDTTVTVDADEQKDVDLFLTKANQIFIFEEITPELAEDVNKKIVTYSALRPDTPITLWINSFGGCVTSGLSIIDTMLSRPTQINTVIMGVAASMAGIISVCGDIRIMAPHSYWMAHPGAGKIYGDNKSLKDSLNWFEGMEEMVDEILIKRSKLKRKEIQTFSAGGLWLDAKQALDKGVADRIMPSRLVSIKRKK